MRKHLLLLGLIPILFLSCRSSKDLKKSSNPASTSRNFYENYSKKFNIQLSGNENKDLILAIDSWMGVPHKMGGCSKSGVDCSCLVKSIYKSVYHIDLERTSYNMFDHNVKPVTMKNLETGDLVFFKIDGRKISHVGIYIKDQKFVHASTAKGVIISSLEVDYYKKRFA